MNFVGPYACDRASMTVEAGRGNEGTITVLWGSSASEATEWVLKGTFDEETLVFTYENGVKTDYVYDSEGNPDAEDVAYTDGTGTVTFVEGDPLTVTWNDEKEHVADDMTFEWAFER